MTASNSSTIAPDPAGKFGFLGCIVAILAIVFTILGIYHLVVGSVLTYVFYSARMFSPATIAIVAIIAFDCFIYFLLAFRVKRQHWLISLGLLSVVWLVLSLPLRLLINTATARVRIDGYAMGATLPNGSYLLADRQAYQHDDPQRGDIVIFRAPFSPNSDSVKRIVGLPGEVVSIENGLVSINGAPINEPYISEKPLYDGAWKVPETNILSWATTETIRETLINGELFHANTYLRRQFGYIFLYRILEKSLMSIMRHRNS